MCSTIFWFKYGFILGDVAMSIVNGFGLLLSIYSALIYHHHTPHRFSCQLLTIFGLSGTLLWLIGINRGWIKLDGVGFSAMTASVVMFAAPLTAIYGILRNHFSGGLNKPRKRMNIWLPRDGLALGMILISLAVSGSWFAYGLVIQDKFVVIPNGLGLLMSFLQYSVWCISYPTGGDDSFSGAANSNTSSRAESRKALLNCDPFLRRPNPNSVAPIEMKIF